ncbi:winged helix-turn-helix domain-containing protein [Shewanella corallii]|uniref:Winged helix-turn-helix domain-containing protein n=2 Tax=Shewanella TaxID=22 RepID=A0ABT0N3D8_9GAMM|nr:MULTISPECIES: winged helix-turn-helix domain-containing protein [Shewanella]MCL1036084.1 winged helix-turn-helix domain-containing protein [Shewanella submarina]MCL2912695.1 winged helix-turn-helix domain-containing protein [Shewanella corallii]
MENVSKQHKAFLRKLYLAYLIGREQHNLLSLQKVTGMPRRTLQDAIAAFGDVGIEVSFVQSGVRNNAGYYQIDDWGPIQSDWIAQRLPYMASLLASS